jgi:hypothetical protein
VAVAGDLVNLDFVLDEPELWRSSFPTAAYRPLYAAFKGVINSTRQVIMYKYTYSVDIHTYLYVYICAFLYLSIYVYVYMAYRPLYAAFKGLLTVQDR